MTIGFLASRRLGRPRSFYRRWRMTLIATFWRNSGCLFLRKAAVIAGSDIPSRFSISSVPGFIFGAQEPAVLCGTVPGPDSLTYDRKVFASGYLPLRLLVMVNCVSRRNGNSHRFTIVHRHSNDRQQWAISKAVPPISEHHTK